MKFMCTCLLIAGLHSFTCSGQFNEWTWVNGDTSHPYAIMNAPGVYDSLNQPRAYYAHNGWVDKQGHFWYYETYGRMWEYDPSIEQWRMVWAGQGNNPVYGLKGIPSAANDPGYREFGFVTWTDTTGELWLLGGIGWTGMHADLWKYNIPSGMWTWMSGSGIAADPGVYGIKGVPSVNNYPVGRAELNTSWLDTANNALWLYGGQGGLSYRAMGDLWKYEVATNEWTWMHGDTVSGPVYGTQRVPDPANSPGRMMSFAKWTDLSGNFYFFGGGRFSAYSGNETWKYHLQTNEWAWLGGDTSGSTGVVYGSPCTFDSSFTPAGAFENKICWTDRCGNGWIFSQFYNTMWVFRSGTGEWGMVRGNPNAHVPHDYGIKGISSPANYPLGSNGVPGWIRNDGAMYFFNHSINAVMWKYVPDPACAQCYTPPVASFSTADSICPGTCIDFTSLSQNAASCTWIFTGAIPDSSTALNPTNICYQNPGSYSVQLIVTNPAGSDTLLLNNYITVFPFPASQSITQSGDTLFAQPGAGTYQWYYNSSQISGATEYFLIAQQNGDYSVVCTDPNGCESEAVVTNVVTRTGERTAVHAAIIYPDPVTDVFYVVDSGFNPREKIFITVYSIPGRIAFTSEGTDSGNGIAVTGRSLAPGIYWIELRSAERSVHAKFVKD